MARADRVVGLLAALCGFLVAARPGAADPGGRLRELLVASPDWVVLESSAPRRPLAVCEEPGDEAASGSLDLELMSTLQGGESQARELEARLHELRVQLRSVLAGVFQAAALQDRRVLEQMLREAEDLRSRRPGPVMDATLAAEHLGVWVLLDPGALLVECEVLLQVDVPAAWGALRPACETTLGAHLGETDTVVLFGDWHLATHGPLTELRPREGGGAEAGGVSAVAMVIHGPAWLSDLYLRAIDLAALARLVAVAEPR